MVSPSLPHSFLLLADQSPDAPPPIVMVLLQLIVIIVAARVFAYFARLVKQPIVVGEIAAGLVLGPSCFGHFLPGLSATLFDPTLRGIFETLSELGLILLMFLVGLDFDAGHLRGHGRTTAAISMAGIALPFALGLGLAALMFPHVEPSHVGRPVPWLGFLLFMGIAMSITAIPVLARIMMELGITRTRIGTVTMSAAAMEDACGWILLATVSSFVRAEFDLGQGVRMILATAGFVAMAALVARPLLKRFAQNALRRGGGELSLNSLAVVLVALFVAAMATSLIGIFAIFGALALGAVLSDQREFRDVIARHFRDFLTVFFLPIFFTYTGLRTDLGTLGTPMHWMALAAIVACAVAGKVGGCGLAARWGGFSWRDSLCIGTMMNTRGLMELVVITVGRDLGVIPDSVFCMLVLMALATTLMTTPLLVRFMRGTELEPLVRRSGFLSWPGRHGLETSEGVGAPVEEEAR